MKLLLLVTLASSFFTMSQAYNYHPPSGNAGVDDAGYVTQLQETFIDHGTYRSRHITTRRIRPTGATAAVGVDTLHFTFPVEGFGRAIEDPERMWPVGVFLPPEDDHRGHVTPDFSNGLDYPDPYLLTGKEAERAVRYLFRKELFYDDYPHVDALLRHQEERRLNGLEGNRLSSLRSESPFYRRQH